MLWRSSPYSPTLSYPVVLFLSSTARAVVFSRLWVVCLTNRTALTTWISPVSHARNPPVITSEGTVPSEDPGPSSLGHHFLQPCGPCETGLHPTVGSQLLPAFQCARFPNPIERILSQQPVLSGDTFDSVLAFLKLLVEVKVHALILGVSDVHILLIFYPHTVGTPSNRLSEAISSGCSVD
jgi:hypothetical protein